MKTHKVRARSTAIAIVFFAMFFVLAASKNVAHAADTITVDVTGKYGQTEARTMLKMVNDLRTGRYIDGGKDKVWAYDSGNNIDYDSYEGLGELTYDYELEKAAMQRAMECAMQWSHTRPSNKSCSTAFPEGYAATGENIAIGYGGGNSTAKEAFDGWCETTDPYSGQGHRRNMLGRNFNRIGIGHVVIHWEGDLTEGDRPYSYKTDIHVWVQELGKRTDTYGLTDTAALDEDATKSIEILRNNIEKAEIKLKKDSLQMTYGETYEFNDAIASMRLKETWPEKFSLTWSDGPISRGTYLVPIKDNLGISSSDNTIASVATGNIISANKVGTTTIKVSSEMEEFDSVTIPITVVPASLSGANISVSNPTYTGNALTPTPTVTLNGKTLQNGVDYDVSYTNNVNAGNNTAKITITGKGNYKDSATKQFTIEPKEITDGMIASMSDVTYNGSAQTPELAVKDGGKTLAKGTDYTVAYSNNTNAGTATVIITGKGNYKGEKSASFTIKPRNIDDNAVSVNTIPEQIYDGTPLEPAVTVMFNGSSLKADGDFSVTYSDNTGEGTGKATITGSGNFTGTRTATFNIISKEKKDLLDAIAELEKERNNTTDSTYAAELDKSIEEAKAVANDPSKTPADFKAALDTVKAKSEDAKNAMLKRKAATEKAAARSNQKGKDGTALGAGASAESAEKAIVSFAGDEGPKGSKFAPLLLRSVKQGNTNINLTWNKVKGAKKYVVYGNACGKKNKMKKLTTVSGKAYNVKKISKKLKKGTYHKFMIVALDSKNNVVSTSKVIHVATKGGKVGNHKSISITKKVVANAKKLKKGRTLKLGAKAVVQSNKLKVKKHRAITYESSNPKIASVSKKGVVKARKKGTCYIYAYAQNGVYRKVKLTVK